MTLIERPSVCTFDCPDTCSLTVTVEDERIVKVRGSAGVPFTDGVICNKVAQDMTAFVHGPDRLRTPLRRTGPKGSGQFEAIRWPAALAEIRDRVGGVIERWGPQAVLPLNYAGPHGMLAGDSMSLRFFHKLGASLLYRRSLCGAVRSEAWTGTYGAVPGIPPELAEDAKLNVIWGNNATVANLHLVRKVRRSLRKGGKLIVVDPKRTKIAEQADLHLGLRPGTDVLLAWALAVEIERRGAIDEAFVAANVLGFEAFMARAREWPAERAAGECGLRIEDIRTCAQWMAEAEPLVLSLGNGLERNRAGGSGIRAAIALPALLGKLGRRGGIVLGAGNAFPKTSARLQRPDLVPPGTRTLNILDVGRHLMRDDVEPPLRALFIYNHNPIVVHPDQNRMRQGLRREDIFTVGIDVSMTESMAHSDIVLPAATHFECDDLYAAYGHHWLQRAEPVIRPQGESLPNTEIFRRLAHAFGFGDSCFKASDKELMDEAVDAGDVRMGGIRPSAIPLDRGLEMRAGDGRPFVLYDNVRPATPSGKIELVSETLAGRWGEEARLPMWRPVHSPFPLNLITPASDRRISSTLGGLHAAEGGPPLVMNPADAAARGLAHGQPVRVWNDLGEVILPLEISDAVSAGVIATEKGAWLATSSTGQTVSALVSADDRADLAQGACFNDARVEVEAAAV
ncbi:MAG: molybdopterin-dependent oxidoreductase [Pseudomonadota bacterium]|nr:molybdopterin-dependent oxidoreductase [Pseudomonadota bacterium]